MAARITPSHGRKDKHVRDAIILALNRYEVGPDGARTKRLTLMCEALVKMACDGDLGAIKEIADKCDSRPIAQIPAGEVGHITISWLSPDDDRQDFGYPEMPGALIDAG